MVYQFSEARRWRCLARAGLAGSFQTADEPDRRIDIGAFGVLQPDHGLARRRCLHTEIRFGVLEGRQIQIDDAKQIFRVRHRPQKPHARQHSFRMQMRTRVFHITEAGKEMKVAGKPTQDISQCPYIPRFGYLLQIAKGCGNREGGRKAETLSCNFKTHQAIVREGRRVLVAAIFQLVIYGAYG